MLGSASPGDAIKSTFKHPATANGTLPDRATISGCGFDQTCLCSATPESRGQLHRFRVFLATSSVHVFEGRHIDGVRASACLQRASIQYYTILYCAPVRTQVALALHPAKDAIDPS